MTRPGGYSHRATLRGWTKWLLVLALPFSAFFFDTWLNVEMLNRDYEIAEVNRRLQQLRASLDELRVETASLETMDRIEIQAPDLGLVEPEPSQIQIIYAAEPEGLRVDEPLPYANVRLAERRGVPPARYQAPVTDNPRQQNDKGTLWDTHPQANPPLTGARLRNAIASACTSYLGDF